MPSISNVNNKLSIAHSESEIKIGTFIEFMV